ncbi:hypothetical protein AX15_007163, partial [Amanita polypyramis BW_CC]
DWLTNLANIIHIGWIPSNYQPSNIATHTKHLNKSQCQGHTLTTLSAATAIHIQKEKLK